MTSRHRHATRYDPARHGPRRVVGPGFNERVYAVLAAARLGLRSAARQVGYALAALPDGRDDVPWHRVVNARGALARRSDGAPSGRQRRRLRADGVVVTRAGRVEAFARRRHVFGA
jgi:alkylated DNA nucleotide flippase Atl1